MIYSFLVKQVLWLIEHGFFPDFLTRAGIRHLCQQRLHLFHTPEFDLESYLRNFMAEASEQPIAPLSDLANDQHYEVPAAFYNLSLGQNKKYSCCFYNGDEDLDQAEKNALETTCERAGLADGLDIMELGCGWGSLTLWMAEKYPNSKIVAISNSNSQRLHIKKTAEERGIAKNLKVMTADMNDFNTSQEFDRIVSVEMFEHMRNHQLLLERISTWLKKDGTLFVHIFCHKTAPYKFESEGASNWMGKYFFSGGIMPSFDLLKRYNRNLVVTNDWQWSGTHYERTCNDWLKKLDKNKAKALPILQQTYGHKDAKIWFYRWRVFYMACAELFGMRDGSEWFVAHYLFKKK